MKRCWGSCRSDGRGSGSLERLSIIPIVARRGRSGSLLKIAGEAASLVLWIGALAALGC